ncbi:hypothetical protein GWN42_32870 [candidate division KSB1 bacterium]|nr:hypothetical protein [candidate division KSB1 bacterium]
MVGKGQEHATGEGLFTERIRKGDFEPKPGIIFLSKGPRVMSTNKQETGEESQYNEAVGLVASNHNLSLSVLILDVGRLSVCRS